MPSPKPRSSPWFAFGIVVFFLIIGLPAALVFTGGTILVPLQIIAFLGPFVLIHYILWGWWLSPRQEARSFLGIE